jgi:hypothetical protein
MINNGTTVEGIAVVMDTVIFTMGQIHWISGIHASTMGLTSLVLKCSP